MHQTAAIPREPPLLKGIWLALRVFMLGWLALAISACGTLPSLDDRTVSRSLTAADTQTTALGRALTPQAKEHPGKSGVYPLAEPHEAFAARMLLTRAAERTLDVQYYIWRKDQTGTLLFEALHAAADRGVRVRLLLDDNNTSGLDRILAALDSHPQIEVRLFNPFTIRKPRILGYATDFFRTNRRMHNKSFTADSQVTIIGGRNIGDEYFGATESSLFEDLDALAIGPVVDDVSQDFDRYWASASSYPVDLLLPPARPELIQEIAEAAALLEQDPEAAGYFEAVKNAGRMRELLQGKLQPEWAVTRMISDDPGKALGMASLDELFPQQLKRAIGEPVSKVDLVSSYFVPCEAGTRAFAALAEKGVKIRILTNSLEATDVPAVHAGYAKWRQPLLRAGIRLYEKRKLTPSPGARRSGPRYGPLGSSGSGSSLHSKTFAVDGATVYIGSFNFDPRSARLNTELGFVIDSPKMAHEIEAAFDRGVPAFAYEVKLAEDGSLYWLERRDGTVVRHDEEPGAGFWTRAMVWFISLFPIDWLL